MTNPKLTLYIDIVSPFAYLAYYVTRVRFDENPNDKTIACVSEHVVGLFLLRVFFLSYFEGREEEKLVC
jgi:hypothetical protein